MARRGRRGGRRRRGSKGALIPFIIFLENGSVIEIIARQTRRSENYPQPGQHKTICGKIVKIEYSTASHTDGDTQRVMSVDFVE